MSVNDMIKKSVLNSFSQYNMPKMALALLVALLGASSSTAYTGGSTRASCIRAASR